MLISTCFILAVLLLELVFPRKTAKGSLSEKGSFFWLLVNFALLSYLMSDIVHGFNRLIIYAALPSLADLRTLPFVFQLLLLLVIKDFVSYISHRIFHYFDFMWKFHSVHHSSMEINALASFKHSLFENLTHIFISCVLGRIMLVETNVIILVGSIFAWLCIYQHADIDFSRFKFMNRAALLFITPMAHRVHHEKLDSPHHRNFGFIFSFWDRLFLTYSDQVTEVGNYGISSADYPYHSNLRQLVYPFGLKIETKRDSDSPVN